jgi:hypothetical protein
MRVCVFVSHIKREKRRTKIWNEEKNEPSVISDRAEKRERKVSDGNKKFIKEANHTPEWAFKALILDRV